MKKNIPRFLAWLLLLCGLAGPGAARFGSPIPPGVLRWLVTAGAALMILSFFWFPRRSVGRVEEPNVKVTRKRTAPVRRKAVVIEEDAPPVRRRVHKRR